MDDRKRTLIYKGVEIIYYLGSNYAYVKGEPFDSVLGAKMAITIRQKKAKRKS